MHLEKLMWEKEEWVVSPMKRVEVQLVFFQQLVCFHDWFFPLAVWKHSTEQWTHYGNRQKSWAVRTKLIFFHTTWTVCDILLVLQWNHVIERGDQKESLLPLSWDRCIWSWKLPGPLSFGFPLFCSFFHFQPMYLLLVSSKAGFQWTTIFSTLQT